VGLDYHHIDPLKVDFTAVTEVMSSAYATRFGILPIQVTTREVVVATTQPFLRDWEKEIRSIAKKEIRRVMANPVDVARYLVEFYNLARSVKKAAQLGGPSGNLSSFEQLVELGRTNRQFDANDQHIVNIVDWLWQYAFEQRASDIHIEPRREIGIVRFRIDGVLHQVYQIPMSVMAAMVNRVKILGRMDVVEKRRPQDGRIKTRTADGQEAELRLSTLPTAFGEKLVMRIFDPEVLVRSFADLGFSDDDQARWKDDVGTAQRHHPGDRPHRFRERRRRSTRRSSSWRHRRSTCAPSRTRSRWSSRRSTRCRCRTSSTSVLRKGCGR
jgi:general secretion pathway protein E